MASEPPTSPLNTRLTNVTIQFPQLLFIQAQGFESQGISPNLRQPL